MPFYNCTTCARPVELDNKLRRGQTAPCPVCGTTLTFRQLNLKRLETRYDHLSFVATKKQRTATGAVVRFRGRSPAAPTRTTWPGMNLNGSVTHVASLTSAAWTGGGVDKIYLAYNSLDVTRPGMEGLIIDCPEALNKPTVQAHFMAVKVKLESATKPTDVAEATGEAAAALCILRENSIGALTLAGFDMQWGLYGHSGPGIDQIWSRTTVGGRRQYLIVEAKGPNQNLSLNLFMPPNFQQMGMRWIMHNLHTMTRTGHAIATNILADLKLTTGDRWPHYSGASKTYYGVLGTTGLPVADLYAVTVTAVWHGDGMLGYVTSDFKQLTNFTF